LGEAGGEEEKYTSSRDGFGGDFNSKDNTEVED